MISPEMANKLIARIDEIVARQTVKAVDVGVAGMNALPKELPLVGNCGCGNRAVYITEKAEQFKKWLLESTGQGKSE